ncbi:MAG: hypothetical protein LWX56_10765 [Ignavibacteria bacterium]|nr:hypothetical protein [Ignavibacteria bacterium]
MIQWSVASNGFAIRNSKLLFQFNGFKVGLSDEGFKTQIDNEEYYIILNGYVLPRAHAVSSIGNLADEELVAAGFAAEREQFIQNVKGNFSILIFSKNEFWAFSDHSGIIKFFSRKAGSEFFYSNTVQAAVNAAPVTISQDNIAIYAVFYHFIDGLTMFKEITYSAPAAMCGYRDGKLTDTLYFDHKSFVKHDHREITVPEMAKVFSGAVKQLVEHFGNRISLSLTGGMDTRNVLASLLGIGITPHLYTYGNPLSDDGVFAGKIAKGLNLPYTVHDIQFSPEEFGYLAQQIITQGNSLASIHRAHRIKAIAQESVFGDVMYMGTLGGEYIKGVSRDDYITSDFIQQMWESGKSAEQLLAPYMQMKMVKLSGVNTQAVLEFCNKSEYFSGDVNADQYYVLSMITSRLHDAQDINLYGYHFNRIITPFLDIDYLEALFSSQHSFMAKNAIGNKMIRRIQNPRFGAALLNELYAPLSNYEYTGRFYPREVNISPYYAALMKGIRTRVVKTKFPPNFPLGQWMTDYITSNIKRAYDYNFLKNTFELDSMMENLTSANHIPKESYWLKYSNVIQMMLTYEELCK